ncbi:ABC transporter substrate-binding protein [Paenibacillus sp. WLX2291]|uniref:ABC transporter substrate-binding protein n=1 Tax=Paenibacillus sp. WLX2291 TaxID=3296934 RepID=UPI003983EC94
MNVTNRIRQSAYLKGMTLVMLAFGLLLVGCSTQSEGSTSSSAQSNNGGTPAETIQVQHAFGTTAIPAHPERIASYNLEDMLLSLHAPLVAAVSAGEDYYLADQLDQLHVPILNMNGGTSNLEAFINATPDLIVASAAIDQTTYEQLSQIAPTIVYDRENWKQSIVELGNVLGLEQQAQTVLKQHDEKVAATKEAVTKAAGEGKTVAFLRTTAKEIRLYLPGYTDSQGTELPGYGGMLYNNLGFTPLDTILQLQKQNPTKQNVTVSLETLPDLNADYVFVTTGSAGGTAADRQQDQQQFKELSASPLWQSLPAIKQNHLFTVDARHWISTGPIADEMKMDDVEKALGM